MLKFAATAVVAVMAAAVYAIAVAWGAHPLPFVHGGGGLGGLEGWGAAEHDLGVDMVGADAKSSGVGISVAPSAPHPDQGVPLPLAGVSAMALAVMAAGCAALVLALIAGLVGDAVDALWVCYAQDCELCTCAQPGVHQVRVGVHIMFSYVGVGGWVLGWNHGERGSKTRWEEGEGHMQDGLALAGVQ